MAGDNINQRLIETIQDLVPKIRFLKSVLTEGADINYQDIENGFTPLMYAVKGQHDRIAEYLLRQGANPLIKNHENKIASLLISPTDTIYPTLKDFELLFAVLNNDLLIAETAIMDGALINFKGVDGSNGLMIAVEKNLEEMVEFLLIQGADPTVNHANGQNLFDLTTNETIRYLLEDAWSWSKNPQQISDKKSPRFFTNSLFKQNFTD